MLPHIFPLLSFLTLSGAMETGIVGGKEVKKHSRPYLVSVQQHGSHKCGGILIRKDFVLTAAHCLNPNLASDAGHNNLEVVLGAHNIQKREKSQQRIKVIKNIWHPKYKKYTDEGDWRNLSVDIMLLKLKSNAKLDKFVKALALPSKNNKPPVNVKCTIAGWGMRNPGGKTSDVLYETSVLLLPPCECERKWQQYFDPGYMMCTATTMSNAFCQGDSGGPLVCSAKPQGLAIYTYPDKCNEPDYPQVSLNITPFLDWIASVINKKIST
ncbi:granzyme B-like [Electrophorus electricus]|uniref:granzyme B-like n=1 Tax=Electrophorus electricus TaxID=8005 RepID=UPI0015CFA89F|nr:granzyme B-like [Electrophorus electricus]